MKNKKEKSIKTIVFKIIVFVVICTFIGILKTTIEPVFTNELALMQMSNSSDSSMYISGYSYLANKLYIVNVLLFVAIFWKELKLLTKKTIKRKRGE